MGWKKVDFTCTKILKNSCLCLGEVKFCAAMDFPPVEVEVYMLLFDIPPCTRWSHWGYTILEWAESTGKMAEEGNWKITLYSHQICMQDYSKKTYKYMRIKKNQKLDSSSVPQAMLTLIIKRL